MVREQSKFQVTDPFTPGDFEERVRLPAGRVGGTQWGNECSGERIYFMFNNT